MVEKLGTIVSFDNSPNTNKAYAILDKEVFKGSFVKIKDKDSYFFSFVNEIYRSNPFFEDMLFRTQHSKNFFPVDEWHKSIAELKILAYKKGKDFSRVYKAPFAGSEVFSLSDEELIDFLSIKKDGIYLGNIEGRNLSLKLDLSKLLQKHLAVLAMSGAGKSYFISVLLEELIEKSKLSIILFDLHGEYKHFAKSPLNNKFKDYSKYSEVIDCNKIKLSADYNLITYVAKDITDKQRRLLRRVVEEISRNKEVYSIKDLIEYLKNSSVKENTKASLIERLEYVDSLRIFGKSSSFSMSKIKANKLTIFDLSAINEYERKQMIVYYIASRLFRSRITEKTAPFLIVLEEAHNFIPQQDKYAVAKNIFETIAREGRKFGASLCLVSQRPINLSTTVLSQCSSQVYLRIINPNDLKHISESSEALDKKSIDFITSLRVGEALIIGPAVNYPVFFKVRKKYSQDAEHSFSLEELAESYYNKEKKFNDDLSLYL